MNEHPENPSVAPAPKPPETPVDAGSQALAEALRSSFAIVKFVMVVLLLVFLGSGFFTVGQHERAIKLRLGKPVGDGEKALLGPGLHWSFPYPIDEYVKVSISGIQRVTSTVGWYYTTAAQEATGTEPPVSSTLMPGADGYVLTADNNIAHTKATVTYRINEPIRYIFGFVNASNAIQSAMDSALLHAASRFTIDGILTREVVAFNEAVRKRLNELVAARNLGIQVEQCTVQSIPPRQLKNAFENVLKAEVGRSRMLNDARSYENQVLNKASADTESRINSARSDRARLVADISSRADQFVKLLPQYRENPNLFVQHRFTETLGRVLTNAQDKVFVPEGADGNRREIRYLFNREPRLKTAEEPQQQ